MALSLGRRLARSPGLGPLVVQGYRTAIAAKYLGSTLAGSTRAAVSWLFGSREYTNFTYDITPLSRQYIAAAVSVVVDRPIADVLGAFEELENDSRLRDHIARTNQASPNHELSDDEARYGRRLAWYAIVRLTKPQVVVETGVDKGLGSCLLTAALMRNDAEGGGGRYFGTDINPAAGFLLSGEYSSFGTILYGDSLTSLRALEHRINVFINDSDHSADYEAEEYRVVESKLADGAVIIGDNCERTDKLLRHAQDTGRRFIFAREESVRHIHPGTGVGFAFR
jgi:predicted O-methyltransferase YrrM